MDYEKAKYAACILHQMVNNDIAIQDAEKMAYAYVTTYNVMQPPLTAEEQEEIRKRMLACIDANNVKIPAGIQESLDSGRCCKSRIDVGCCMGDDVVFDDDDEDMIPPTCECDEDNEEN